jgi:hypothetical protein
MVGIISGGLIGVSSNRLIELARVETQKKTRRTLRYLCHPARGAID